jgi:hypothetical protein
MRDAYYSPPWYGMKLTMSSQSACNIDFNCYDLDCKAEPALCNDWEADSSVEFTYCRAGDGREWIRNCDGSLRSTTGHDAAEIVA